MGLALLVLVSCTKDSHDSKEPELPAGYYIKYKINGTQIALEGNDVPNQAGGIYADRGPLISGPGTINRQLVITATTFNPTNSFRWTITSDSVKTGQTYVWDNSGRREGDILILNNSEGYRLLPLPSTLPYSFTIHIIKHQGGWITGTFSGYLGHNNTNNPDNSKNVTITEGTFSTDVQYRN